MISTSNKPNMPRRDEMKIEIEETADYDLFKAHKSNRKTDPKLIERLKNAIMEKNLLLSHPVIVDKHFFIIDGQHRVEAAKQLGIPVNYIMDPDIEPKDMITSNTNLKPWNIVDYMNYYCSQEYPEYLDLDKFISAEKLQLNIALQLLNGCRSPSFFSDFKKGLYKFPCNEEYLDAMTKKNQIKEVIEFIKKRTSGGKTYLDRVTFYGAMVDFFNCKSFCYDVFMKKLQYKIDLIHPCTRQCEYVGVFREIYNWKNQSPIEIQVKE